MATQKYVFALLVCWSLATATGLAALWTYETRPSLAGDVPRTWPTTSKLAASEVSSTLSLFLHSECVCSRATLRELERTLADADRPCRLQLVVFSPAGLDAETVVGRIDVLQRRFPAATIVPDDQNEEAIRFGVYSSGHVVAHDSHGRLIFSGGITAARGHEGENLGRTALLEAINDSSEGFVSFPVFGCLLRAADGGRSQ